MKVSTLHFSVFFLFSVSLYGQVKTSGQPPVEAPPNVTLENISSELTKVTKSLQTFNERINQFLESVNKYKGIQLTEQQQKLIFGYEVLNQTEQLAATLRKTLLETSEREAATKRRLGQIEIDLKPDSLDRSFQLRGTTRADELRETRRRSLEDERNTLQKLLAELVDSRNQITENLRQTEIFLDQFRRQLFAKLNAELNNL